MQSEVYWESVCGNTSVFWDVQVSWNSTSPSLTECFRKTVLVWVPCLFLWILSPIEFYSFSRSRFKSVPWMVLNITKLVLCALLFLVEFSALIFGFVFKSSTHQVDTFALDTYASVMKSGTMVLAFTLIFLGRRNGIISSTLLLFFWLLYFLSGALTFYFNMKQVMLDNGHAVSLEFTSQLTSFPMIFIQLILSTLPDSPPKYAKKPHYTSVLNDEESASFLSKVFFIWYNRLAWLGYRRPLTSQDFGQLNYDMQCNTVVRHYMRTAQKDELQQERSRANFRSKGEEISFLGKRKAERKPRLIRNLIKTFGWEFGLIVFLKFIADILAFTNPLLLSQMIHFVSSNEPDWHGYIYTGIFFFTIISESLFQMHSFNLSLKLALEIRAALMTYVFKKALRLSTKARAETTVGQIVNLMSEDITNTMSCVELLSFAISSPFQVIVALAEVYLFLGPAAFVGLATIIAFQCLSTFIMRKMSKIQSAFQKLKDERTKLMNELLAGIKVLKLLAWEVPFGNFVNEIRLKELKLLKKIGYLNGLNAVIWETSSFTISLFAFTVFVMMRGDNVLDASRAFVSITVFNILRRPLMQLPNLMSTFVKARVSINRLTLFTGADEIDTTMVQNLDDSDYAVIIENGYFSWGKEQTPSLAGINFKALEGSLVAIVGQVGCGKSSFLSSILGEMNRLDGNIFAKGRVAYAPQVPWIQNTTVKNNILFGRPMYLPNYDKAVYSCALRSDLEILPAGDLTEIGERGINLSGGQRHRVSLARAVYCNADVYLLDDPLSAVDVHVGKHIFDHVIGPNGLLAKKTRILVTHAVTYLPYVDTIVVMEDGMIKEIGSYQELMDREGTFSDFITNYATRKDSKDVDSDDDDDQGQSEGLSRQLSLMVSNPNYENDKSDAKGIAKGKFVKEETVETGKVKRTVFVTYLKSFGLPCFVMVITIILAQICNAGTAVWLIEWSSDKLNADGRQDTSKRDMRLGVYAALGCLYGLFMILNTISLVAGSMRASRVLHKRMLDTLLRAPQWFFDQTPVGRILNRFSRDVSTVDQPLPQSLRMWQIAVVQVAFMFLVIIVKLPWLGLVALPMVVAFYFLQNVQIGSKRQLQRIDSASRSPIFALFSESISGASVIRAFGCEELFFRDLTEKIDVNSHSSYLSMTAQRWLNSRLDLLGSIFLLFAAVFSVSGRSTIEPGTVGLVISYTISISNFFKILFRYNSALESDSVSVERILEYCFITQEAEWILPNSNENWPKRGTVAFHDYETRYRDDLDTVLKGVTCNIEDNEKIGIVGRTGAGKSSITLALLRIMESTKGTIFVDGVDISLIGLHNLRSKINIIPQDPVLFSGSLRRNLDPFDRHSDENIWKALELAHLKDFVTGLRDGIDTHIEEGGGNLSVGQRQLVCLARSLLRKTKILILDEATAAVDLETDAVIQSTIRTEFADCTILTIAHRLNTIMDSDKIMVLDRGLVVEFDSPQNLLQNPSSVFSSMAKDAGLS